MDMRKVQRFTIDPGCPRRHDDVVGSWRAASFRDLKKGDVFRLFESSGEPDISVEGGPQVCVALSDAAAVDGGDEEKNYAVQSLPLNWYP